MQPLFYPHGKVGCNRTTQPSGWEGAIFLQFARPDLNVCCIVFDSQLSCFNNHAHPKLYHLF